MTGPGRTTAFGGTAFEPVAGFLGAAFLLGVVFPAGFLPAVFFPDFAALTSPHQVAAVHRDDASGDVARGLRAEEEHDARDVLRIAEAAQHTPLAGLVEHLGGHAGGETAGTDVARRHRVHVDVARAQ